MQTFRTALAFLLLGFIATSSYGQSTGHWNEVVGKKVVNRQGVLLGYVSDSVIDLEHGRYVGALVNSGGFLGLFARSQVVPPAALVDEGVPGVLYLDMDKARFRNAPTFKMSQKVGPPQSARVAQVYRYYGEQPYFATQSQAGSKLPMLGYVKRGSSILLMPVDNLQGKNLGFVYGFRDLNRTTGLLGGVIIMPDSFSLSTGKKIVPPQALRYNLKHTRLRLNDHDLPFADAPDFAFAGGGRVVEDKPVLPSLPPPPLVQGNSRRDKAITLQISQAILADGELSHYAKTIEIGTVQGKTTLRGRVQTAGGHAKVLGYAEKAAGRGNVIDLLEVRPMTARERAIDTVPPRSP